ncbi:hypothetical protein ABLE68_11700 [Nocardioides sp. CN2-186]|uniref:hypothetical protein n=1 Tax=Nocardioides tweenelious TaxID=3156607 RepID=UPI0032B3E158
MGAPRRTGWFAAAALVSLAASTLMPTTVAAAPAHPGAAASVIAVKGDRGAWQVQSLGSGRYAVSWTSPTRFPLTSDRPTIVGPAGLALGAPTIGADGRTVSAVVTSTTRPDPAELDVLLSGDRLDTSGDDRLRAGTAQQSAPLDLPGTVTLAEDPATPGPYDVVTSDYELAPLPVDGMPEPIEMRGHVVEPTADSATGPRPLVLFLHGRHGVCYKPGHPNAYTDTWPCPAPFKEIPSDLGYDYIQQVLASQGYATVSVRVNGINAQDYQLADGGADARAQVVEAHLDHWVGLAAAHQVDLGRVVLVGHSRGGEGVNRASIQIPLSAPYRIVGQVLIAPTDFASQTAPYVPTVTLLPFCDGDVSDLQGQKFTDTARDLASDDTSLKSSVLVMGADHNFFNTEWTPGIAAAPASDDWYGDENSTCGTKDPERLSPQEQQNVGTAYVSGAVHLFADDDQAMLPLFDGSRARVASQGSAQTLSHAIGGGRDLRLPGLTTGLSLASGAQTRFCQGDADPQKIASCTYGVNYASVHPHWPESYEKLPTRPFFQMTWTATGQTGGLVLDDPLDLTGRSLELRTIVDPRSTDVDLRVRVTDSQGGSALLTPVGGGTLPSLGDTSDTEKLWAQTLVVDPSTASGVDLTDIDQVDLVSASDSGRIWIADLGSAPATLPAVPGERLPTIDFSDVRIDEGDGPGQTTARVPFEVVGDVARPARFVVQTTGQAPGDVQRFTVDLAPGQTSGSIPIGYTADKRDDYQELVTQIVAWPLRGVMTDDYLGSLTITDDDPRPAITIRPLHRKVAEGEPATWRVRIAHSVDYDLFVNGKVVKGRTPTVKVDDIGEKWISLHTGPVDEHKPLWSFGPMVYEQLREGARTVDISIPTRRDHRDERAESLTLRFGFNGYHSTSTVKVVDPRPKG